jgi:phosphotransferase system IIB component
MYDELKKDTKILETLGTWFMGPNGKQYQALFGTIVNNNEDQQYLTLGHYAKTPLSYQEIVRIIETDKIIKNSELIFNADKDTLE